MCDVFSGGNHTYNRTAAIIKQLQTSVQNQEGDPEENIQPLKTTHAQENSLTQSTRASSVCKNKLDITLSLETLLKHVQRFEELNETFGFRFESCKGIENLTNSAHYMCIKKAFTPFAALHMLKQIQQAVANRRSVVLEEKEPLVEYILRVPNNGFEDNGLEFPESVYHLKACQTSRTLKNLTCSCSFYNNFHMVCWHQIHLLERLQIKNVGGFENLKNWREYVGYKSRNMNDKRTTSTYKVQKNRRLKSFIEEVTKKHQKKMQALCKEKGIEMRYKKVGE